MRIVITGLPDSAPIVLDNMNALLFAADDGAGDSSVPCIAHGDPKMLAGLAAVILMSVRAKLGARVFESVVSNVRGSKARVDDVTDAVRLRRPLLL